MFQNSFFRRAKERIHCRKQKTKQNKKQQFIHYYLKTTVTVVHKKNVSCHINKQRMLQPSSHQLDLTVHLEGIQDGEKKDTGPR